MGGIVTVVVVADTDELVVGGWAPLVVVVAGGGDEVAVEDSAVVDVAVEVHAARASVNPARRSPDLTEGNVASVAG